MKKIVAPNAGVLSTTMTARADRLQSSGLRARLLQSSLWKPSRVPAMPPAAPRAQTGLAPALTQGSRAAARIRLVASRVPISAARAAASPARLATQGKREPAALVARSGSRTQATRASLALQHTISQRSSVVGPVSPGGSGRMPPLQAVARALTQRDASRGTAKLPTASGSARSRIAAPVSQAARRSRPAAALAAQTRNGGERSPASASAASPARLQAGLSSKEASPTGTGADPAGDSGGGHSAIALSGDIMIDGRRMGEVAASAVARNGSSAQTAARSPNFRSTALPSGLSAPLP